MIVSQTDYEETMKKIILPTLLVIAFASISFFSISWGKKDDTTPYIVATTSQVGDLLQNIAGDTAKVEFLMGEGIDPHLYHPTRSDISKLLQSDVIFYNGMNLEGKMEHFLEKIQEKKPAISIAASLSMGDLQKIDGSENYDPHVWMDVRNWITASDTAFSILSLEYPLHEKLYQSNKNSYTSKLIGLHRYATKSIASIPEDKRILITAHDAFGYFGSAYGIKVIGIQGISTESEAGLGQIKEIVDLIVERKIPSIFIETSVGGHNIRAIIEGAQAQGHGIEIGGYLYSDAMGTVGTPESTYIGMMVHNIKTITSALGGQVQDLTLN